MQASKPVFKVFDLIQPPHNITERSNAEKFGHDNYLAISVFELLSYVVVVDIWLVESGEIFGQRWAILDDIASFSAS